MGERMAERIVYGAAGRRKLLEGMETLTKAVGVTLMDGGRTALLTDESGRARLCSDARDIVGDFFSDDPVGNVGLRLLKKELEERNGAMGSGAARTMVLTAVLLRRGEACLESGMEPTALSAALRRAALAVDAVLENMTREVEGEEEFRRLAVGVSGSDELGELIVKALSRVESAGEVVVERSHGLEDRVEFPQGFSFEKGYLSPFMTDVPGGRRCVLDDCGVLMADKAFRTREDMEPVLHLAQSVKKPVLMLADDLTDDALRLVNEANAGRRCRLVAVEIPAHGPGRMDFFADMEVLVGGTPLTKEFFFFSGLLGPEVLGRCRRVVAGRGSTLMICDPADPEKAACRAGQIREQMRDIATDFVRETYRERLRRLTGRRAVLSVGAMSESAFSERRARAVDAVRAVFSARRDGVVAGGGAAYVHALAGLENLPSAGVAEQAARSMMREALAAPFCRALQDAGERCPLRVAEELKSMESRYGYDSRTRRVAVTIEPARAAREDLARAVRIAEKVLTLGAVVLCRRKRRVS